MRAMYAKFKKLQNQICTRIIRYRFFVKQFEKINFTNNPRAATPSTDSEQIAKKKNTSLAPAVHAYWHDYCFFDSQVNGSRPPQNDELEQETTDILHVRLLVRRYLLGRSRPGHQAMGRGVRPAHVQHHRVRGPSQSGPVPRWQVPEHRLRAPHVQRGR